MSYNRRNMVLIQYLYKKIMMLIQNLKQHSNISGEYNQLNSILVLCSHIYRKIVC